MTALFAGPRRAASPSDLVVTTTTPGVPFEIRNLTHNILAGGLGDVDYTVHNVGNIPAVAVVVILEVMDGETTGRSVRWIDTWLSSNGGIRPNEDYGGGGPKDSIESNSKHFDGARIRVATALLADGSVVGDNPEKFRKFLSHQHELIKAEYRRLQPIWGSADPAAFSAALSERPKNIAIRSAHDRLSQILKDGNSEDLRSEFARVLALQP